VQLLIKEVSKKYERLDEKELEKLPLIVESKITHLKTKELVSSLQKILGKKIFEVILKKRTIRSGKGKSRGRKYKKTAGLLLVIGKGEKLKTNAFEVTDANKLGILDLAKGGPGRLTLYTEQSIKDLGDRLK